MSEEEKELLAKISQVAGKINRHKNQQAGIQSVPSHRPLHHRHQAYRPPNPGGGYRVGRSSVLHRHRSLVLNGGTQTATPTPSNEGDSVSDSSTTWVSKSDRHLQLIRSSIYEKDSQARSKAIEETRQQKQRERVEHEKALKIQAPCKIFSTTGSCSKGPRCRYIHDPSKVAVCKDFLLKGTCLAGDHCDLSHDLTPERTPACLHFAKGNCANYNCPYTHSSVSPGAPVCRAFGLYGYCDKADQCPERHVFECPDFSNTGKCSNKGCKLLHRERASVLRKANRSNSATADDEDDEMDDGSSSDRRSSVSEEAVVDTVEDTDFQNQKDFVSL